MSSYSLTEALKHSRYRTQQLRQRHSSPPIVGVRKSHSEPGGLMTAGPHATHRRPPTPPPPPPLRHRNDEVVSVPIRPWHSPRGRTNGLSSTSPPSFSIESAGVRRMKLHQNNNLQQHHQQHHYLIAPHLSLAESSATEDRRSVGTEMCVSDTISHDPSVSDHFLCQRSACISHSNNCSNSTHQLDGKRRQRSSRRQRSGGDANGGRHHHGGKARNLNNLVPTGCEPRQDWPVIGRKDRNAAARKAPQPFVHSFGGIREPQYLMSNHLSGLFANANCLADQRSPSQQSERTEPEFGCEDLKVRGQWHDSLTNADSASQATMTDEQTRSGELGTDLSALTLSRTELSSAQVAEQQRWHPGSGGGGVGGGGGGGGGGGASGSGIGGSDSPLLFDQADLSQASSRSRMLQQQHQLQQQQLQMQQMQQMQQQQQQLQQQQQQDQQLQQEQQPAVSYQQMQVNHMPGSHALLSNPMTISSHHHLQQQHHHQHYYPGSQAPTTCRDSLDNHPIMADQHQQPMSIQQPSRQTSHSRTVVGRNNQIGLNSSNSSFSLNQSERSTRESNSAREEVIPASDDLVHLSVISCSEAATGSEAATTAPAGETEGDGEGEADTTLRAESDRLVGSVLAAEDAHPRLGSLGPRAGAQAVADSADPAAAAAAAETIATTADSDVPTESRRPSRFGRLKTPEICKRSFLSVLRHSIAQGHVSHRAKMKPAAAVVAPVNRSQASN